MPTEEERKRELEKMRGMSAADPRRLSQGARVGPANAPTNLGTGVGPGGQYAAEAPKSNYQQQPGNIGDMMGGTGAGENRFMQKINEMRNAVIQSPQYQKTRDYLFSPVKFPEDKPPGPGESYSPFGKAIAGTRPEESSIPTAPTQRPDWNDPYANKVQPSPTQPGVSDTGYTPSATGSPQAPNRYLEMAGLSPTELRKRYEGMGENERPIHVIHGTNDNRREHWFNPSTQQKYGSFTEGMAGQAGPMTERERLDREQQHEFDVKKLEQMGLLSSAYAKTAKESGSKFKMETTMDGKTILYDETGAVPPQIVDPEKLPEVGSPDDEQLAQQYLSMSPEEQEQFEKTAPPDVMKRVMAILEKFETATKR